MPHFYQWLPSTAILSVLTARYLKVGRRPHDLAAPMQSSILDLQAKWPARRSDEGFTTRSISNTPVRPWRRWEKRAHLIPTVDRRCSTTNARQTFGHRKAPRLGFGVIASGWLMR
jgi:hypothetical protein